jgi:tetratricopeptide (TPR) repeat protein
MVCMAHELPAQAEFCYQQAAVCAPQDFRWPYLLGYMYEQLDYDTALRYFRKSLELNPSDIPARLRVATTLLRLGNVAESEAVLRAGIALHPKNPHLLVTLGRTLAMRSDHTAAQQQFEQAAALPGWVPHPALMELVKLTMREGRLKEAMDYQRRLLQLPQVAKMEYPDSVVERVRLLEGLSKLLAERADFAMARGDIRTAISLYESLVRKRPDLPNARINLAQAYGMAGQWPEAIERYQQILNEFGDQATVRYGLASTYGQAGQIEQAIAEYERVLNLKPDHKQAWFQLGLLREQRNELEPALKCYREAVAIDPSYPQGQLALGALLLNTGHLEEARPHVERAAQLAPGDEFPKAYLKRLNEAAAEHQ